MNTFLPQKTIEEQTIDEQLRQFEKQVQAYREWLIKAIKK
jgi:hypothetical protein